MTTSLDYTTTLSNKSDTELSRMLAGSSAGESATLTAAEAELRRRQRGMCRVAPAVAPAQTETVVAIQTANQPLSWPLRLFIFVTAFTLLGTLFAAHYEDQDKARKAEECWMVLILGVVGWCLAILLGSLL